MTRVNRAPLANADLECMEHILWAALFNGCSVRATISPAVTKAPHGSDHGLLQLLEDKGYVARDRSLSVHLFSAAISRQTYAGQQLESLADKLTAGSFAPLITHLVAEKKISRDEINRIRVILDGQVNEGDPT